MSILDDIVIAAPCPISWESMIGTERVRHCSGCSKDVFNLSDMSTAEAEQFLHQNASSNCLRFFRRSDGKLMTDNCPRGLRAIRNKCRIIFKVTASIFASFFAFIPVGKAQSLFEAKSKSSTSASNVNAPAQMSRNYNPNLGGYTIKRPGIETSASGWLYSKKAQVDPGLSPNYMEQNQKRKNIMGSVDPACELHAKPTLTDLPAPLNGDMNAYNLYVQARKSENEGHFLVARTQLCNAIDIASKQVHSDQKFISIMKADLLRIESKAGLRKNN